MIWGIASGVLVENKIQNPHSIQVPELIRASLARGQGGMVGAGKNMWPNVNIEEGKFTKPSFHLERPMLMTLLQSQFYTLCCSIQSPLGTAVKAFTSASIGCTKSQKPLEKPW